MIGKQFGRWTVVSQASTCRYPSGKTALIGNSRACCKTCNYAKNTMSEIDFINWIQRVHGRLLVTSLLK